MTTPDAEHRRYWTVGRVLAVVLGSLLMLAALAGMLVGGILGVVAATQRDSAGYFHTNEERLSVGSYAITSDEIDLGRDVRPGDVGFRFGELLRVRLRAESVDPQDELFLGIARASDVQRYLRGIAHDVVDDIHVDPFRIRYSHVAGDSIPRAPGDEDFWEATASGFGRQTLTWEPEEGHWVVVMMNAYARPAIDARVDVGVQIRHIWVITGVLFGVSLAVFVGGLAIVLAASRHPRAATPPPLPPGDAAVPLPPGPAAPTPLSRAHPVRLVGRLDEPLSRWLWLVKWILAIPHLVVLLALWIVAVVLTVVAGVAILFTGRYPRGIFDFNVGVLRWSWRVSFYATGVLGTDRYPPFTIGVRPEYPASLEIAYPDSLSRGLVLVKWWLLALPHYAVLALIGTGWWWGWGWGRDMLWLGGGLVGVLVVVAAVRLLFTHRYPRDMFDLVMGLQRWGFRVAAYALLMTDTYPPFRLDQGGSEAGTGEEPAGRRTVAAGADPG